MIVPTIALAVVVALTSWPMLLAAGCGVLATHLTELLVHKNAPDLLKSTVNLALATLAGVLVTVTVVPGQSWKDYAGLILGAWLTSLATHTAGFTSWAEKLSGETGVGKRADSSPAPRHLAPDQQP